MAEEGLRGSGANPPAGSESGGLPLSDGGGEGSPARRRRRRGRGHRAGLPPTEAGADPRGRDGDADLGRSQAPQTPRGLTSSGRSRAGSDSALGEAGESGAGPRMGEGASGGARKRRRGRGGRGRNLGAEPRSEALDQPGEGLLDIPVERGLPVLYAPLHAAEEDDPEDEGAAPAKGKKLNAGKLFWFIRSKSYVPIPEIRRRFEISAAEMSTIVDGADTLYVGLPEDAASAVATLRRQQKIGIECSPDFSTHVVIGLYPLKRL